MCAVKVTMCAYHNRFDYAIKFSTLTNGFYIMLKLSSPMTKKKKEGDFEVIIYIYIRVQL
jgi:hypothetical protein